MHCHQLPLGWLSHFSEEQESKGLGERDEDPRGVRASRNLRDAARSRLQLKGRMPKAAGGKQKPGEGQAPTSLKLSLGSSGCCLVAKSCPTLYDPMNCSMSGSSVLLYLSECAQIHVH